MKIHHNEEDFTVDLGFDERNDSNLKELDVDSYKKMLDSVAKVYPNGNTLREVKSAVVNDWAAIMLWADESIYTSREYKGLEIMDRVGGGDSFV